MAHKYAIGDLVRHVNYPDIIYKVEKQFLDGSYRIVPTNADMGYAITYSTDDAMTPVPWPNNPRNYERQSIHPQQAHLHGLGRLHPKKNHEFNELNELWDYLDYQQARPFC